MTLSIDFCDIFQKTGISPALIKGSNSSLFELRSETYVDVSESSSFVILVMPVYEAFHLSEIEMQKVSISTFLTSLGAHDSW